MEFQTHYLTPDVKLSRYEGRLFKTEATFDYHMLIWFISGETRIIQADATYTFHSGDVFLIPRNQPTTVITAPTGDKPHQAVAMHLTTDRLMHFYRDKPVSVPVVAVPKVRLFPPHPLLDSCLASLLPYFQLEGIFPEDIAALKITEALAVLRKIDPEIDGILANFDEPGKIDLVDFMEKNFAFNLPLATFSYLTGRSLATFNRDFRKAFAFFVCLPQAFRVPARQRDRLIRLQMLPCAYPANFFDAATQAITPTVTTTIPALTCS